MLHFIAFLEFLVAIVGMDHRIVSLILTLVVFALGLALGLAPSGFSGWPVAIILLVTAVRSKFECAI